MRDPSQELIDKLSKRYAEHVIVARSATQHVRYWKFQKPGDCHYAFEILATKSCVTIQGDIGNLVFNKSLDWCRGVLCRDVGISWRYVAEKVIRGLKVEEYSEDLAKKCFAEYCRDYAELDDRSIEEAIDDTSFETYECFIDALESSGCSDPWEYYDAVMALKHDFLNQVVGLREFIKKLDGVET